MSIPVKVEDTDTTDHRFEEIFAAGRAAIGAKLNTRTGRLVRKFRWTPRRGSLSVSQDGTYHQDAKQQINGSHASLIVVGYAGSPSTPVKTFRSIININNSLIDIDKALTGRIERK